MATPKKGVSLFTNIMDTSSMDTDPPSLKRPRETVENDGAYIPDNGGPHTSIIFSLNDEKGALVNALKPFQVREGPRCCNSVTRGFKIFYIRVIGCCA